MPRIGDVFDLKGFLTINWEEDAKGNHGGCVKSGLGRNWLLREVEPVAVDVLRIVEPAEVCFIDG